MSVYKTTSPVPLSYVRIRGGLLVTGLSLTVRVVNAVTGATLLATTTMTEISPGFNVYSWSHGISVFTECMAVYVVGGLQSYVENFSLDETLDKEESLQGKAV